MDNESDGDLQLFFQLFVDLSEGSLAQNSSDKLLIIKIAVYTTNSNMDYNFKKRF